MTPAQSAPLAVSILCRHPLIRAGVAHLVQAAAGDTVTIIGSAEVAPADPESVDVVLYDLLCHQACGAEDLRRLAASVPVVALSRADREDLAARARATGVRLVVREDVTGAHLLDALHQAAGRRQTRRRADGHGLTERERQVLSLVGAGLTNENIAQELVLSVNSIKSHLRLAYRKINVSNRSQAVLWAVRHHPLPLTE